MSQAEVREFSNKIASYVFSKFILVEMTNNRGKNFKSTKVYQLRFKPSTDHLNIPITRDRIAEALYDVFGASDIQINLNSINSSKYSSVSFRKDGVDFDIVFAAGGNVGEKLEKKLVNDLRNLVKGKPSSQMAVDALSALNEIHHDITSDTIEEVIPRVGITKRSRTTSPEESGKIIADFFIKLKSGKVYNISLKAANGKTVASFGLDNAFNSDFTVNQYSRHWIDWVEPFNLDIDTITKGLNDYGNVSDDGGIVTHLPTNCNMTAIKNIIRQMWGSNYTYLKQTASGFDCMTVDETFLNKVTDYLRVSRIVYPSCDRKSTTIILHNDFITMRIELRDAKGGIKPTQIQLQVSKTSNK